MRIDSDLDWNGIWYRNNTEFIEAEVAIMNKEWTRLVYITLKTVLLTKMCDPCWHNIGQLINYKNFIALYKYFVLPNIFQRSTLLEFHRRATLGYSQELAQSIAELSRVQKVTTPPAYLKSLDDFMRDPLKGLITKAVKIVSQFLSRICIYSGSQIHRTN